MWESRLSGSERGWRTTLVRLKYCGTAGKPGGNREDKPRPGVTEVSCLLEKSWLSQITVLSEKKLPIWLSFFV